jgi:hypothetical protein
MRDPLVWCDDKADNPPWIKALAEVRHLTPREGWCYPHVQAIIVAIDQYAEAALGNRELSLPRVELDNINQPDDWRLKPARLP